MVQFSGTIMSEFKLRPAQQDILAYSGGRMAVSAVPGSGKTFTLALLAAQLIADGRIDSAANQQVLIVTYMNASVDTFKARIRRQLDEMGLPPVGFDVRTQHSLALEIVRLAHSTIGEERDLPNVIDEVQANHVLSLATDSFIEEHPDLWAGFLSEDSPQLRSRWRSISQETARSFISAAKNSRYQPEEILQQLRRQQAVDTERDHQFPEQKAAAAHSPLLYMMAEIYHRYQSLLVRQAAHDFDDLIWQATHLLEQRPQFAASLRQQWPYVLEDEAQDSVPLQELLIQRLTGENGNWVRVGDPNQAITSTFTAAHPRFFNLFIDRADVISKPLPNSGRCAPIIYGAANHLLDWVIDKHPVPEVRQLAFRRQHILPTPPGDAQPNPLDSESDIRIKVYKHREDEELPAIAKLAMRYALKRPDHTLAILVPTNRIGYEMATYLDKLDADYDNLLRGGSREKEIAAAIYAMLSLLASPLSSKALVAAHASLHELGHPSVSLPITDLKRLQAILRSVHRPESLLFPNSQQEFAEALPAGIADQKEIDHLEQFVTFLQRIFKLRHLPIDDLVLALGEELFAWDEINELDLSVAFQLASILRRWRDMQPDWRLPELAAELGDVASGRRRLPLTAPTELGYEPKAGRITLATQHSAKGLEWDAVFLLGIDGFWIPGSLEAPFLGVHEFLGGDPTAEATAQLKYLMEGDAGLAAGLGATETSHIEVICERLRLLYVGISRARRYLHLSRSRASGQNHAVRDSEPATVLGVLYQFRQARRGQLVSQAPR